MKVIAIDGPAAAGKGVVSKPLAAKLGMTYFSTGSVYRIVARRLLDHNISPDDCDNVLRVARDVSSPVSLSELDITGEDAALRTEDVSSLASTIAASEELRHVLIDVQRDIIIANKEHGIVVDGRDVGTVVCPEAVCKIFITADVEERAKRRFKQLQFLMQEVIYEDVLRDLKERDERDMHRDVAPLKPAGDAVLINSTFLNETELFDAVFKVAESKLRVV